MKQSLEWHKQSFANTKATIDRQLEEISRLTERVTRETQELSIYGKQIDEAIRRNLDGFDRDKLLKKRGAK